MSDAPRPVPVPLLDLKKQYQTIKADALRVTEEIYEAQAFILGPRVEAFEKAIADYTGARHAIGMSSGTDALLAAMMALGIGPGDDVVTSAYSFFATAGVVARLGARPVFCDIDPETYNLDPGKLPKAITPKTKAIQPVHLYGQCAEMNPILEVAKEKGIPVIEDACQSLGSEYKGRKAGTQGEIGCYSFFPSKNLGGFGDGGMVTTSHDGLAETLRALRMHGETTRYHHRLVGGNFRLDALQAVILHVKLPRLDGWADARRANAREIEGLYRGFGGSSRILFPFEKTDGKHVFNQLVLRVGDGRDALVEFLKARDIGCAIYYPVPLHLQECFASLGGKEGDFPEAERAARQTIAIPVFPELTLEQKLWLAFSLAEFSKQG